MAKQNNGEDTPRKKTVFWIHSFEKRFLDIYDYVRKALEEDFNVFNGGNDSRSRNIMSDIIPEICKADYIVADLSQGDSKRGDQKTGFNPNVWFELGVAMTCGERDEQWRPQPKKVVMIIDKLCDLPFDLGQYRTLEYGNKRNPDFCEELKKKLRSSNPSDFSNPVFDFMKIDFFNHLFLPQQGLLFAPDAQNSVLKVAPSQPTSANSVKDLLPGAAALISEALLTPECKRIIFRENKEICFSNMPGCAWRLNAKYNPAEILAELCEQGLLKKQDILYFVTDKAKENAEKLFERDNIRVFGAFPGSLADKFFELFTQSNYSLDSPIFYGHGSLFPENRFGTTVKILDAGSEAFCSFNDAAHIINFCRVEKLTQYPVDSYPSAYPDLIPSVQYGKILQTKFSKRGKQFVEFLKRNEK